MKLTRDCLYPWNAVFIHAGGLIQPCCVSNDMDYGDFIMDFCDKQAEGEEPDVFNNDALQSLRKGLLTGNLRKMCRNCPAVSTKLITTEQLENNVRNYLKSLQPDCQEIDTMDLTKTYRYSFVALGLTNRCNLSCIYCNQSTLAKTNPYYKMDFPEEYIELALEYLVKQGMEILNSGAEGEGTIYRRWREVFSTFHEKHPEVKLRMTTNFSRLYSEEDLELISNYYMLDISCDTLNPELFQKIRRNGDLNIILKNLENLKNKIISKGIKGPIIMLHMVVCDMTWTEIEPISEYAFANGYGLSIGNYEERPNALAYQQNLLKPISTLPLEIQEKIRVILDKVVAKAKELGLHLEMLGDLLYRVNNNVTNQYNRFLPYDDNPVLKAFCNQYPFGLENMHLDIVYDYDCISYEGILIRNNEKIHLENVNADTLIVREVELYKEGTCSTKYEQSVLPKYRKKVSVQDGIFEYKPNFHSENIDAILVEINIS